MLDSNLSIIFGTFGTGKTYYAVRDAYKAYLNGSIVISNMWLAFPHIRWYQPSDLPPILHEIYDYHEKNITPFDAPDSFLLAHDIKRSTDEPRSFYILADEGGVFFNSRNFQTNFREKSLLVMLAEPRHFNMQITAITQELDLIDKTFRDLAQEIIEFTPFLFGIFRRATSYDKNRMFSDMGGLREEIPILDSKTYFHWWHRRKDTSNFFGGLYYTKEVLGDLALVRQSHILSLVQFFEKEDTERDWRESFAQKAISRFSELNISQKLINKFTPKEVAEEKKRLLNQDILSKKINLEIERLEKEYGRPLYQFEVEEIELSIY